MPPAPLLILALTVAPAPPAPAASAVDTALPRLLHRTSTDVINSLGDCQPTGGPLLVLHCTVELTGGPATATFAFDAVQVVQTIAVDHRPAASRAAALVGLQPWVARLARDYGRPSQTAHADGDEFVFRRRDFRAVLRTRRASDGTWAASSQLSNPARRPGEVKTL